MFPVETSLKTEATSEFRKLVNSIRNRELSYYRAQTGNDKRMREAFLFWKEREQEIRAMVAQGMTQIQIAKKYCCRACTISEVMSAFGIKVTHGRYKERKREGYAKKWKQFISDNGTT